MNSKGMYLGIYLFVALLLSIMPALSHGKTLTHVVKKGDTLWSICETYYGDPYLWPELWEMNQFITNPHWIKPDDMIKLIEDKEIKEPTATKELQQQRQAAKKPNLMGVDVSSFTNVDALGLLLRNITVPWGTIIGFSSEKIMHTAGETAYVQMNKEHIKPGDIFTICNVSDPLNHPLNGKKFGYLYSFKGLLEIEKANKDYHTAKITKSFKSIQQNDLLIPYHRISSCLLPIPYFKDISPHIVAAKDQLQIIGQYSVVYLDAGSKNNIQPGNIFEAVEKRNVPSEQNKKKTIELPPTILGKIIILNAAEDTAIGVVFSASKNFHTRVKVRPTSWRKQPKKFAHLPGCPLK